MSDWALNRCRENIGKCGWNATGTVSASDRPYVYTTGLTTHANHPELVVAGLDPQVGWSLLKAAVAKIEDGTPMEPGTPYEGIAEGFAVRFRNVSLPYCQLSFAVTQEFYGTSVPFRQLIWPDKYGKFPDEAGCGEWIASAQDIGGVGDHG
jgi:hypothetical protein